jgi:hypothetical protein
MLGIGFSASDAYPSQSGSSQISLSPRRVTRTLLIIVAGLVTLSLIGSVMMYTLPDFPLRDTFALKFAVGKEQNFPTLYSSLTLFFCAFLLEIISRFKKTHRDRYARSWRILAIIFAYLSVDELLEIHETMSRPMHAMGVNGFWHNAWVIPAFFLLLIFAASYARFFLHLPRYMKRLVIFSAVLFLGGALVIEVFGGYYAYLFGRDNLIYALFTTVEEVGEMLGVVVFIYALLTYIKDMGIRSLNIKARFS